MNKKLAVIILAVCAASAFGQEAKVRWSFDALADGRTRESVSGKMDALEGYAERAPGVRGDGLRLDGFTACLRAAGSGAGRDGRRDHGRSLDRAR